MRRLILVLTAAAVMATMLAVGSSPAMADHLDFDDDFDGFFDDDFDGFFDDDFDGLDLGNGVISQEFEQEAESGDVDLSAEISNEGDNTNLSTPVVQFANTGNLQNQQGFVGFNSETDDVEFEGGSFEFDSDLDFESDQSIEQAATAFSF